MDPKYWRGAVPPWLVVWLILLCSAATLVIVVRCCCKDDGARSGPGPDCLSRRSR